MLSRGGSPITASHLDELEEAIGSKLPAEYRTFLLEQNGGATEGETISFFGLDLTPERRILRPSTTDVPPETMPFATMKIDRKPNVDPDDQPHGPLIIAHNGPRKGHVFFWNDARWTPFFLARHEAKNEGSLEAVFAKAYDDFFSELEPVAPSFSALVARMGGSIVESMPAIDESDIEAYEATIKKKLPNDYRRWVLQTNGARVENARPITLETGVAGRVTTIAPVRRSTPQPTDLRDEHKRLRVKIPEGTLPIASGKGARTFLLETRSKRVLDWMPKQGAQPIAKSFDAFLAMVERGEIDAPAKKLTRPLGERDYREFVNEQLEELTPALVADLENRVFVAELAKETTSLDFEVFKESFDGKLPIVAYQMNGERQVNTANIDILPDTSSVIPKRLFEPFGAVAIEDEEGINAALVMQWFIRGWRAARGAQRFAVPARIMIHDEAERVLL